MISGAGGLVSLLGAGGLLAAAATVVVAIIQAHSGKGGDRAHAADLLARGYGGFADRLAKDNENKDQYITGLRSGAIALTDAIDELLDMRGHCEVCIDFRDKIRSANNRVKVLL